MVQTRIVGSAAIISLVFVAVFSWGVSTEAQPDNLHEHARMNPAHHVTHPVSAPQPAEENLRTALERLLGHHAILAIRVMRGQVQGSPDLVQSLQDALSSNTNELTVAVESLHGAEAAQTFERLWTRHLISLFKYGGAVGSGKQEGKRKFEEQLDRYRTDFGAFVETASDGKLKGEIVAESLKTHIDQLLTQVEAYAAKDYSTAYRLEREAFAHMFPTGKALAGGLAVHHRGESSVALENPAHRLKSALALLLGEHVELLVEATRTGASGSPEFKHAAAALDGNTKDLTESISALFGQDNALRFNDLWADHINVLMDYTIGKANGNQEAQDKAMSGMRAFIRKFPRYLTRVTGERVSPSLSREIGHHEHLIVDQLDAYAARRYTVSHRISNRAYEDMISTAVELGGLLQKRFSKTAPVGGAQTGGGGTG